MSPKAEHIPLLVNVGQRVRIVGHPDFFWKAFDGHLGRIIEKAAPHAGSIIVGREQVLYHVRLDIPVLGYPPDVWVSRCDFVLA